MKKYSHLAYAFALAVALGGLPAAASAERNGGSDDAVAQRKVQGISWQEERAEATSSDAGSDDDEIKDEDRDEFEIEIGLEDDDVSAVSFDDLEQKMEERKLELEDEEASTTPKFREVVKNANEVRLAVHTLLASKELLGGIGPQVSEIAKQMNDSVATTTNIEAKVRSRGFLARLLFGGDRAAGEALAREVEKNQQRIGELTEFLGRANVPANIQAILEAQLDALKEAQARLQELADTEQNQWGLFSWRLFRR